MKQCRKIMSALLAASLVFSLLSVNASARAPSPADDPAINPWDVTAATEVALNTGANRQIISFPIGSNFTYWKIHIVTTNPKLQFSIAKDSPAGEVVYDSTQAGYGEYVPTLGKSYYGQLPAGTYYILIRVADGQTNLQGTLWYEYATSAAALPSDSLASTGYMQHILNPYDTTQNITFNVSEGFNWYQIALNTRTPGIRFSISKASGNGETVRELDETVTPDGKPHSYYGYLPAGNYILSVSVSGGGHNLGGALSYKFAATEAGAK